MYFLVNLEQLYCTGNDIRNIEVLGNLTKLKVLFLGSNWNIENYAILSKLQHLERLNLESNKLKHIEFILSAEIKPKTKNDIKILKFNKCFDFTRKYEYDSLVKQDDSGNYILHLLGRNGEPKKKYELELNLELFEDAFENRNFEKSIILETSNEGTVDLGRLENIKKIEMNSKKIIVIKSQNTLINQK